MLKAERRAAGGQVLREGAKPLTSALFARIGPKPDVPHRWLNAVIPVSLVIACVMLGMVWSGWSDGDVTIPTLAAGIGPWLEGWKHALPMLGDWTVWRESFANAEGAKVLFWSAMIGSATALMLAMTQRILPPKEATMTYLGAIPAMRLAIVILILAWSIRAVCDDVGTSVYLVAAVQDLLTPVLLPLVTFLLAAVVAISTGTSWGTMGILLPAMIPVAYFMTFGQPNAELILFLCFAAVLDGSIFGDHCSPISDTTVMSSISSSCDHLDHVRTQLPYAVTTMLLAAGLGYLGLALGAPLWTAYAGAVIGIVVILFGLGKPAISN
jgi:Na+/H+ antiporter NhaC